MPNYPWLIFDADDTLFDYNKAEAAALSAACQDFGQVCPPNMLLTYQEINARIWRSFELGQIDLVSLRRQRFALLFEQLGLVIDPDDFSDRYLLHLGEQGHMIDGALEVVQSLSHSHQLVLMTNGISSVQRSRLSHSPLQPYFPILIISEEIGVSKPHPAIFEAAFEKMGHPSKQDVLMIGDSLTSDMTGALNYGIAACWFNPHHAAPDPALTLDYEIHTLGELLEIVH
jgi:2-haloacid dehalogenase